MDYLIRRARTSDVRAISALVAQNVDSGRLLAKATVTLYEDVPEFWVAERAGDGLVAGCGALHVMWEDLAEESARSPSGRTASGTGSATGWSTRCWAVRGNWECGGCSC